MRKSGTETLDAAAAGNDPVAHRILGELHLRGFADGKSDPEKTRESWQRAADLGDKPSLLLLAKLAEGVFPSDGKADPAAALKPASSAVSAIPFAGIQGVTIEAREVDPESARPPHDKNHARNDLELLRPGKMGGVHTHLPGKFPQGNLPGDAGIAQGAEHRFPNGFADVAEAHARFSNWKLLLQLFQKP